MRIRIAVALMVVLVGCGDNEVNPIAPSTSAPPQPAATGATVGPQDGRPAVGEIHSAGAGTWRGLTIAPEHRCAPYDANEYSYSQSVEQRIVSQLGGIYSPYTCESFESTRETDIEHVLARSEAHDSGLCAADSATKRRFAADIRNLTLASPPLNRQYKGARDASSWHPEHNRCWFAQTVIQIRQAYGLTIDQDEVHSLNRLLAGCGSRAAISCETLTPRETQPEDPPDTSHPPVQAFANCSAMRSAGWNRGVNQSGGTYQNSWDDAERRTYALNTRSDRDRDGHACE